MLVKDNSENYSLKKRMIVGYDCISLPNHFSGAAYYVYTLAEKLLSAERDFSIAIICKARHQHLFEQMLKPGDMIIPIQIKNNLAQLFFYEFRLPGILKENRITLFHATHYICPPHRNEYSIVTTFHDMGFCFHPYFYPVEKRFYFGNMMRIFLKRSDIALTVSFAAAELMKKLFPDISDKVRTVYPGTDHLEMRFDSLRKEDLFEVPFFLAVNTLEKRKNTAFIIKVFNYLKENFKLKHKLVIIGYPSNDFSYVERELNHSKFKSEIIIKHDIPEDMLVRLYKQAVCFLNASEYEGFGFTPVEALRFGCPAFLYRNNVTSELFPDYPYIFNDLNADKWAQFIYSEILSGFNRFRLCEKINNLTWDLSAEKTINCYEKLLFPGKKDFVQV